MNPFLPGKTIYKDNFCERPQLEEKIKDYFKSYQNFYLIGERRIGKTSLVLKVAEEIKVKEGVLTVLIDLRSIETIQDVVEKIALATKKVISEIIFDRVAAKDFVSRLFPKVSFGPEGVDISLGLDFADRNPIESIEEALDLIYKTNQRKKVIIIFDEFQKILKVKESKKILEILRSKIQNHSAVSYAFCGSIRNRMEDIFSKPSSGFYKGAIRVPVEAIDKHIYVEYIMDIFFKGDRFLSKHDVETIYDKFRGNTGDLQTFFHSLWETTSRASEITENQLRQAENNILIRNYASFEALYSNISVPQKNILKAIITVSNSKFATKEFLEKTGIKSKAGIKVNIEKLKERELIFDHQGIVKFYDPYFEIWIKKEHIGSNN